MHKKFIANTSNNEARSIVPFPIDTNVKNAFSELIALRTWVIFQFNHFIAFYASFDKLLDAFYSHTRRCNKRISITFLSEAKVHD